MTSGRHKWLRAAALLGTIALAPACSKDALTLPLLDSSDGGGGGGGDDAAARDDAAVRDGAAGDLADGAPACTFPPGDDFTVRVRELDRFADVRCWDFRGYGDSIDVDVIGVVTTVEPATGRFVVDTCPAWVSCDKPRRVEVTLTWPGRDTQLMFSGAFVRLRANVATFEWYCTVSLQVESVASIGGRANPDGLGEGALYGAARRGGWESYPGSALTVTRESTGCVRDELGGNGCGGNNKQELFQLHFAVDGRENTVPMGTGDGIFDTPGTRSAYGLTAFTIKSYAQACLDQRGFEWVVLPQLHPGG